MDFYRIYDEDLAQASYMLGCSRRKQALVVDPRRDVDVYLDEARQHGLEIVAVADTHIHADYLSGARELAHATGAKLYLSAAGGAGERYEGLGGFQAEELRHEDTFHIGELTIQALHTPGHTSEHLAYLVTDPDVPSEPALMLTGDFVFVQDLGRPDLLESLGAGNKGHARQGAEDLFESLQKTLLNLPGHLLLWPGHGAGSACGKSLGGAPVSTVAYELKHRWWSKYLQENDRRGFVDALLEDQPEAPLYFKKMKELNREGIDILGGVPVPTLLTPGEFCKKFTEGGAVLVDTRDKDAFAEHHLKGAYHVPGAQKFSTWAGWILPYYRPIILLASNRDEAEGLMRKLLRIGHDDVLGYIKSIDDFSSLLETSKVSRVDTDQARALFDEGKVHFLDVRTRSEFEEGHIPGASHVFAGRIMHELDRLPRDEKLVVYCSAGNRSSLATSVLKAHGFDDVINFPGSFEAWKKADLPVEKKSS
ncbi:MAG: MBL fold metallo-hydrolase [Bradymonadaceae bacterium]